MRKYRSQRYKKGNGSNKMKVLNSIDGNFFCELANFQDVKPF